MFRSVERDLSRPGEHPVPEQTVPLRGFRPDVQALRGVAVLAVVLYHAQVVLPGGFVGVDVFFVISGFVIGRVLLAEFRDTGGVSFSSFYVRRARRLLPALAVLLTAVVLAQPLLGSIDATDLTRATAAAAALFSGNLYLYGATEGGYFAASAEINPLLHTWSLAVEEQFYFVIPVLMLAAWRFGRRRTVGARPGGPATASPAEGPPAEGATTADPTEGATTRPVRGSITALRWFIAGLFVVSLALCLVASYRTQLGPFDGLRFAFYAPVTRAWQFAAGLALVVLPVAALGGRTLRRVAVAVGVVALLAAMLLFDVTTRFPGAAAIVPTLGTALIIYGGTTADGEADSRRGVRLRPLIWLGDLSYSWYLWHWPFIVFARAAAPQAGVTPLVIGAAASLVPAWLSYRLLERRVRLRPAGRPRRTLVLAAACVAAPVAAAAVMPFVADGVASRLDVPSYEVSQRHHADYASDPSCDAATPLGERDPDACVWAPDDAGPATPSILLIGDSNAGHFSESLIEAARQHGATLRIATLSACRFATPEAGERDPRSATCARFVDGSLEAIAQDPPDLVVIANATDHTLFGEEEERAEAIRRGVAEPEGGRGYESRYTHAVERVRATGAEVAILATVPKAPGWDPRECSRLALHRSPERCMPADGSTANPVVTVARELEARVAERAGVPLWDLRDELCPGGVCAPIEADGDWLWRDAGHITVTAAEALGPAVAERVATLLP